jgi:hypothetical protein
MVACFFAALLSVATTTHDITIDTTDAIGRTSGHYTCWNIDASTNRGFFARNLSPTKPLGAQLAIQAKAISVGQADGHSLLRFGGGGNDMLLYEMDPKVSTCPPPDQPKVHCLNATWLGALLDFSRASQAKIIFGVAQPKWLPKVNATTPFVLWDPSNARAMLKWIINRGDDDLIYALELGNEVDGFNNGTDQVGNLQILHDLSVELWPTGSTTPVFNGVSNRVRPLLLGPDAAHQNSTKPHKPTPRDAYIRDFFAAAARKELPIHGATLHKYIETTSSRDTNATKLDETTARLTAYAASVADGWSSGGGSVANAPRPWCGECGPHNGGCVAAEGPECRECDHTSMRWATFSDSLWYVDALASAARLSYEAFCRQDYIGADYGLVDCSTGSPLPDFWSAVLWSRLTGQVVLNATASGGAGAESLRTYAHCAATGTSPSAVAEPGSVTLVAINLDSKAVQVGINSRREGSVSGHIGEKVATLYQLTPRNEPGSGLTNATGLNGTGINLNGVPLVLDAGGAVPDIGKLGVNRSASDPLQLPPTSISFVVLHGEAAALCL